MKIIIEDNKPIPELLNNWGALREMEVGQSFDLSFATVEERKKVSARLSSAISNLRTKGEKPLRHRFYSVRMLSKLAIRCHRREDRYIPKILGWNE